MRKELTRLRSKLKQTEQDVAQLVSQASASEEARAEAASRCEALEGKLSEAERRANDFEVRLSASSSELAASSSASAALAAERDAARQDGQQARALAHEASERSVRLEAELAACKRELDRSAHSVALAAKRESQAREALAELGDLSSRRLHEAGAAASEDAAKHAILQQEYANAQQEIASQKSVIAKLEAAAVSAKSLEEVRAKEVSSLTEQLSAQGVTLRAEHASSLDAMRVSLESGFKAREEDLLSKIEANEQRIAEMRQASARQAAHEADESAGSLAALRSQLLSAVQKEVSARGAAQEMAGLLKEQQNKLSSLAEARRGLQAEIASLKSKCAEEVRGVTEHSRQAKMAHEAELGAVQASLAKEQLNSAQMREELSNIERRYNEAAEKMAKEHDDSIKEKDAVLDDLGNQLALPIPRAQFQRAIGLFAGPVGHVGDIAGAVLQTLDRVTAFGQQFGLPVQQLAAEILELPVVHERLILGRAVIVRQKDFLLHLGSLGLAINVRQIQFLRHLALHGRSVYPRR